MYELLIFDADHTLWDFDTAEKNAIKRIFAEQGLVYTDDLLGLYRDINFSLWKKFEQKEISQARIKTERFRLFLQELEADNDFDLNKISHDYLIYLSEGNQLLEGAYEPITDLRKRYRLALLTNGISTVQHPRYKNSVLHGIFEAFVVSGDLGINKPDRAIFEYTLKQCRINDRSKALMIGDSLTSDIRGGINAGLDTCWYNPSGKQHPADIVPTYEIRSLVEIYRVLGE